MQNVDAKCAAKHLRHQIASKNILPKIPVTQLDAKLCYQKLTLLYWIQNYATKINAIELDAKNMLPKMYVIKTVCNILCKIVCKLTECLEYVYERMPYKWREQTNQESSRFWHQVTNKNTVARIVICRQNGRGRFPICAAYSPNVGQTQNLNPNGVRIFDMVFTWDKYLQTIQWNNLTITNTDETNNQFISPCRGQGLLQKCIWRAFKMHANTFKCALRALYSPQQYELITTLTLGAGSSFSNQVYLWSQCYR